MSAWLDVLAQRLVAEHDARVVILYGSRARGAERPESDVDLLVLVPDDGAARPARDTRSACTSEGVEVDVDGWIYPLAHVADAARHADLLHVRGGRVLVEHEGVGASLLAALDGLYTRGPTPLAPDERRALDVWAARMLRRVANAEAGPIAAWRRAELLVELLPDVYRVRGWWYPGPEPALRELATRAPELHAAWLDALAPTADVAALAALVHAALGPSAQVPT